MQSTFTRNTMSLTAIELAGAKSRTGSKGSFAYALALIVKDKQTTSGVYPSGGDFATHSVPMLPFTPAR